MTNDNSTGINQRGQTGAQPNSIMDYEQSFLDDDEGDLLCSQIPVKPQPQPQPNSSVFHVIPNAPQNGLMRPGPHGAPKPHSSHTSRAQPLKRSTSDPPPSATGTLEELQAQINQLEGQVGVLQDQIAHMKAEDVRKTELICQLKRGRDAEIQQATQNVTHEKRLQGLEYTSKLSQKDAQIEQLQMSERIKEQELRKLRDQLRMQMRQNSFRSSEGSELPRKKIRRDTDCGNESMDECEVHVPDVEMESIPNTTKSSQPIYQKAGPSAEDDKDSGLGSSSSLVLDEGIESVFSSYGIELFAVQALNIEEELKPKSMRFKEAFLLLDKLFSSSEKLIRDQIETMPEGECIKCAKFILDAVKEKEALKKDTDIDLYAENSIGRIRSQKLNQSDSQFEHSGSLMKVSRMFIDIESKVIEGVQLSDDLFKAFLFVVRVFTLVLQKDTLAFKPGCVCWYEFLKAFIRCYMALVDSFEPSDDLAPIYNSVFIQVAKSRWIINFIRKSINLITGIRPDCHNILRSWMVCLRTATSNMNLVPRDQRTLETTLDQINSFTALIDKY